MKLNRPILIIAIFCLSSCGIGGHKSIHYQKVENHSISAGQAFDLAFKSYMAGCVLSLNSRGEKGVHQECKDKANTYMREIESIVGSD